MRPAPLFASGGDAGTTPPPADRSLISSERRRMFLATLLLRLGAVAAVAATAEFRHTLPPWLIQAFLLTALPLFLYNLAALLGHKRLEPLLARHPGLLTVDMAIAAALLYLGGGWRNCYFVYTLTTIILFTIFLNRRGAWLAAAVLIGVALVKDPAPGLSAEAVFATTHWDMRVGAALFYLAAGLILGYFDTLLTRLERLAQEQVAETQRRAASEEKTRLALNLHDGAKQMVMALRLRSRSLLQSQEQDEATVRAELEWLWRGLSYLQTELTHLVRTLQGQEPVADFELAVVVREEIQLAEALTDCRWTLAAAEATNTSLTLRQRDALRSFLSEALMNAWKHAGVTTGTIELQRRAGEIVVIVADQGRGFDPTAPAASATLGRHSLRRRAQELGGRLELDSRPGQGCRLTLTFPERWPGG